jgi:hypothetical protein
MKAFILHHANRAIKDFAWGRYAGDFYRVKDAILRKHGRSVGYDVQHIEGKKCHTCRGTGLYPRWDQYRIYDPDACWHCLGNGWYKDPQWICLERIAFGRYIFHRPLKREYGITNPFTKEELGWDVSGRPVINGYIEHRSTWVGPYAIALIMIGTPDFKLICKRILKEWKWYWQRKCDRFLQLFKSKRQPAVQEYLFDEDLPF